MYAVMHLRILNTLSLYRINCASLNYQTFKDLLQNFRVVRNHLNSPYCEISGRVQMSKTIIAVKHFALGGCESLETAVMFIRISKTNVVEHSRNFKRNFK